MKKFSILDEKIAQLEQKTNRKGENLNSSHAVTKWDQIFLKHTKTYSRIAHCTALKMLTLGEKLQLINRRKKSLCITDLIYAELIIRQTIIALR